MGDGALGTRGARIKLGGMTKCGHFGSANPMTSPFEASQIGATEDMDHGNHELCHQRDLDLNSDLITY